MFRIVFLSFIFLSFSISVFAARSDKPFPFLPKKPGCSDVLKLNQVHDAVRSWIEKDDTNSGVHASGITQDGYIILFRPTDLVGQDIPDELKRILQDVPFTKVEYRPFLNHVDGEEWRGEGSLDPEMQERLESPALKIEGKKKIPLPNAQHLASLNKEARALVDRIADGFMDKKAPDADIEKLQWASRVQNIIEAYTEWLTQHLITSRQWNSTMPVALTKVNESEVFLFSLKTHEDEDLICKVINLIPVDGQQLRCGKIKFEKNEEHKYNRFYILPDVEVLNLEKDKYGPVPISYVVYPGKDSLERWYISLVNKPIAIEEFSGSSIKFRAKAEVVEKLKKDLPFLNFKEFTPKNASPDDGSPDDKPYE